MTATTPRLIEPRTAAGLILIAAAATIAGALVFEHVFGLAPCPLCLLQRNPYYLAMPLALVTALMPRRVAAAGLALLALVFFVSAGLGVYHAGVEWGWWQGPNDCAGGPAPIAGNVGDFLKQLETARVVSCTEAAWRFLGLSLAGWNVVISLALAAFAAVAIRAGLAYGSSSVSQYR
jgi:disulfide bond formation protein DsbB